MTKITGGREMKYPKIIIISGEGEQGTVKRHSGRDTQRAIKAKLTCERCNGDRWARAYRLDRVTDEWRGIYCEIDGDDMRHIDMMNID